MIRWSRGLAPLLLLAACSTQQPPTLPDGHCLSEQGCPAASALPPCPAGLEAPSVEEAWARAGSTLNGRRVRVRGPLGVLSDHCSLVGCGPDRCCNECGITFGLGSAAALKEQRAGETVQVEGEGLGCSGDESLRCCGFEPNGQEVIAEGLLLKPDGRQYILFAATLCAPQGPTSSH
jgi:hypothetical protein